MKYLTLVLTITLLYSCSGKKPVETGLEGKPLPAFNLLLMDSATHFNTSSIPEGRPVALFYYNPRCPYCRAQMDEIIKNMDKLKDVRFYMFTTFPFEEMSSFYKEYQLQKYSNIIMGRDTTGFFGDYFAAAGVPYMAIYGKDKKLRQAFIGELSGKQIRAVAEN